MPVMDALKAATSVNAEILHMDDRIGRVKQGLLADLIAIQDDPAKDLSKLHNVKFVMKNGAIYKQ
jgi:imidazolonepropionase-like amidohydrolase